VVVPFNVLGLLGVELLVPELPMPFGLPSPVGLVDTLEPRARIGPLRPRVPLVPTEFLVNVGVEVGVGELPTDDAPVESDEGDESDETDEPAGDVGLQLTPGVMIDDGLVVLVDLVELVELVELVGLGELVDVVEPVPVVLVLPVVCANAGAVLKAIAHARPAPLRIGISRMLVKMFLKMFLLPCAACGRPSVRTSCRRKRLHRDRCNQPADFAASR
jgi:hypothetical protein